MMKLFAELYFSDERLVFAGDGTVSRDGLIVTEEGIEGWFSAPELKVQTTERASGNGAHDVSPLDILYASRVVTLHFDAIGSGRDQVLALADNVSRSAGLPVRLRVVDASSDTFVTGYVRPAYDVGWSEEYTAGSINIVCPRPERLSWDAQSVQLMAPSVSAGGLSYGPGGKGLVYPLDYGAASADQSQVLLRNAGTSRAYPVLTASGDWPDGVLLMWGGGESLEWRGRVWPGVPLVLDCRSRTASMGGVDVSRGLTRRGFPRIEPGSDILLRCLSAGGGWVDVETRDTYI
jgi:hypothetical protein